MNMKIVIASLHFGAGHTAHLEAYMKLAAHCGYESALYLNKRYLELFEDTDFRLLLDEDELKAFKPDIVWIYNTGTENFKLIRTAKAMGCKIAYVLHEPDMGIKDLLKEGSYIPKQIAGTFVNRCICRYSDKVILSSERAISNCGKHMKMAYRKSAFFPLIFPDRYIEGVDRKYFSLIGGYAAAHGSDEYLSFVKECCGRGNIFFQIATRSDISDKLEDSAFREMIKTGQLIVQQGRPLTEAEINMAYRRSVCTWNGYKRSTQSGVLANSFMQGTPVIATRVGSFEEYVVDGTNGVFIDGFGFDDILRAYEYVAERSKEMTEKCRETFLDKFCCLKQTQNFKNIVREL